MKKVLLSLVAAALVTSGAFADAPAAPALSAAVEGNATVTWGINLDDYTNGFKNTNTATLKIKLSVADGSDTKAGEGDVYGSITLKWENGDAGTFNQDDIAAVVDSAVIYAGPVVIDILGSNHAKNAVTGPGMKYAIDTANDAVQYAADTAASVTNGIKVSTKENISGLIGLSAQLNSYDFRTEANGTTPANTSNTYAGQFGITVGEVAGAKSVTTISIDPYMGRDLGISQEISYKLPLGDNSVKFGVNLDTYTSLNANSLRFTEWGAYTQFILGSSDAADAVEVKNNMNGETYSGVKLSAYLGDIESGAGASNLNVPVDIAIVGGAALGDAKVGAFLDLPQVLLLNKTGTPAAGEIAGGLDVSYTIGNVTPFAAFKASTLQVAKVKAGVVVADIVPKVEFTALYQSGAIDTDDTQLGTLDFTFKIAY